MQLFIVFFCKFLNWKCKHGSVSVVPDFCPFTDTMSWKVKPYKENTSILNSIQFTFYKHINNGTRIMTAKATDKANLHDPTSKYTSVKIAEHI